MILREMLRALTPRKANHFFPFESSQPMPGSRCTELSGQCRNLPAHAVTSVS